MRREVMLAVMVAFSGTYGTAASGGGPEGCNQCYSDSSHHCSVCGACCAPCDVVVTQTMVPMMITETQTKYVTETRHEEREVPYTVFKRVPVTKKYEKEVCYLADETRTKVVTWKQCRSVTNPVETTRTVKVPVKEIRHGVRTVCKTIDGKTQQVEEPYSCEVTVLHPEVRTETCERPDIVFETKSKVISYCVKVPKKETVPCAEETVWKLEPVEKTRIVPVCVPVKVPVPCEVTVCKMVAKDVICCQKCASCRQD